MPGLLTVIPEVIQGVNANSVLGNNTGSAGQCVEMTAAQTRALLGLGTTDSPTFADLMLSATDTASSGTALSGQITNTYNQTSTAGSTDLLINRTETALGSGSHYFADFQVGGSKKLAIDNSGNLFSYNSYTDASNNEYLEAGFDTNVAYLRMVSNGTGSDRDLVLSRRSGVETVTLTNSQFQVNVNGAIYRLTLGNGFYPVSPTSLGDSGNGRQWSIGYVNEIVMDKTTSDDGFINFQATADADATSAISTLTTSGATTHHIQVEINGTKAWIAASTNAPS